MHVTAQPTPCRYLSEFARLSGACCTIQDFSDKHQHIVVLTPTWLLHLDTRWLALEFCNRLLSTVIREGLGAHIALASFLEFCRHTCMQLLPSAPEQAGIGR